MQPHSSRPQQIVTSLWQHRWLLQRLTAREVTGRYRGAALGLLWSLFNPLFLLAVYTFVFTVVFQARWGNGSESRSDFALMIFIGMIIFNLFSECVNRAPSLIIANATYVKKVVFPLEILIPVQAGAALFHCLISLLVWLVAYSVLVELPQPTVWLMPLVLLPLVFWVCGLCWFLSALGVYLRDVSQLMGVLTTTLLFLSPVFYPVDAVPEGLRWALALNPLAYPMEAARDTLYWGRGLDGETYALYLAVSCLAAWAGFAWFQLTRRGFADVV